MSCPGIASLEQLVTGDADPAIAEHVRKCTQCTATMHDIRSSREFLRTFRQHITPRVPTGAAPLEDIIPGYELVRTIGRGGQGIVYEACHQSTGRRVALKVLMSHVFRGNRHRTRFEREVSIVIGLRHPGIVTAFDSGTTANGRPFLAMEFVEGPSLAEVIAQDTTPVRQRIDLWCSIVDAVGHAHEKGVIHRDLKPGNIVVDADGRPRILDFGLAKLEDTSIASTLTHSGDFVGTIAYASPEQLEGQPDGVTTRSDVYALGVIGYELLSGRNPYPVGVPVTEQLRRMRQPPAPPSRHRRGIDLDLDTITLKAMAVEPARRYPSANELRQDVERYLRGQPVIARRDSTWYVLRKALGRHSLSLAVTTSALLLGLSLWLGSLIHQVAASEREARSLADQMEILAGRLEAHGGETSGAEQRLWKKLLLENSGALASPPGHSSAYWALQDVYSVAPCRLTVRGPGGSRWLAFDGNEVIASFSAVDCVAWNTSTTEPTTESEHSARMRARAISDRTFRLTVSQSGHWTAAYDADAGLRWWNDTSPEPFVPTAAPPDIVDLCVAARDTRLVVADNNGVLHVFDTDSTRRLASWPSELRGTIRVCPDPTSERFFVAAPGSLVLYTVDGTRIARWFTGLEDARDLAIHPAGKQLFLAHRGAVRFLRVEPGAAGGWTFEVEQDVVLQPGTNAVHVVVSPDGRLVATLSSDGTVQTWDTSPHGAHRLLGLGGSITEAPWLRGEGLPDASFHSVAFDAGGESLWVAGAHLDSRGMESEGVAQRIDCLDWSVSDATLPHPANVSAVTPSPDGTWIATASHDGTVRLWSTQSRALVATADHATGEHYLNALTFSPDGKVVASAGDDGVVRLWRTPSLEPAGALRDHPARVATIAFHPREPVLATGCNDGLVRLWNAHSLRPIGAPRAGHRGAVRIVAFAPGGNTLVSGGDDHSVRIWNLADSSEARVLAGHRSPVFGATFSPDGELLATCDRRSTVHLWGLDAGNILRTLRHDASMAMDLDFSPDRRWLCVAYAAGVVARWDLRYYARHIAGNVGHQLEAVDADRIDPAGADRWREWARTTLAERE